MKKFADVFALPVLMRLVSLLERFQQIVLIHRRHPVFRVGFHSCAEKTAVEIYLLRQQRRENIGDFCRYRAGETNRVLLPGPAVRRAASARYCKGCRDRQKIFVHAPMSSFQANSGAPLRVNSCGRLRVVSGLRRFWVCLR